MEWMLDMDWGMVVGQAMVKGGNLVGMFIVDMEFLSDWWLERGLLWERHV